MLNELFDEEEEEEEEVVEGIKIIIGRNQEVNGGSGAKTVLVWHQQNRQLFNLYP